MILFFVNFSKGTSPEAESIALKISSFVEAKDIGFDLAVDAKNGGPACLDVGCSRILPESKERHGLIDNEALKNGMEQHKEKLKSDGKPCVDNHATDHNYACCGFPMRKAASQMQRTEVGDCSVVRGYKSTDSPKKVLASDLQHKSEKPIYNEAKMSHSRKRQISACNKESTDKERVLPKRYRGPYCEDGSIGDNSSDEDHHDRSRSRFNSTSDEQSDHERSQHNRKYRSSSDTDKNHYKRSYRRHSLSSNDSFYERDYSSSDEDSRHERRHRYDPRGSESDLHHKRSSGSDRGSDSDRNRHRRRERSRSKDRSAKRNVGKENKTLHDIELERKMGFKFDHNIKGTAKVQLQSIFCCCFVFRNSVKHCAC